MQTPNRVFFICLRLALTLLSSIAKQLLACWIITDQGRELSRYEDRDSYRRLFLFLGTECDILKIERRNGTDEDVDDLSAGVAALYRSIIV